MMKLIGRPISGGMARGRGYVLGQSNAPAPRRQISSGEITSELNRIQRALQLSTEDLLRLSERVASELGASEGDIFLAHIAFLNDRQHELFASDLLEVDRAHLLGVVTEQGGATGHAAIRARALGIPAVTGIARAMQIPPGALLLVDGGSGGVWVQPDEEQIEGFGRRRREYSQVLETARSMETLVCATQDGARIGLFGNIGRVHEADDVVRHNLDGVALSS